jgi:ABC-type branched-subunit amino acid transport system ATPase component
MQPRTEWEIVGLIGPNGFGKTTLLNVVSGISTADQGEIFLSDRNIGGCRPTGSPDSASPGRSSTSSWPEISALDNIAIGRAVQDRCGLRRALLAWCDDGLREFERMDSVYRAYLVDGRRRSRTCAGVSSLINGAKLEIGCIARLEPT